MKGAIAVPSVSTIRVPNSTKNIMIGANHHFLRTLMNSENSEIFDNLLISYYLQYLIVY